MNARYNALRMRFLRFLAYVVKLGGGGSNVMLGFNEGLLALLAAFIFMCIAISAIFAII